MKIYVIVSLLLVVVTAIMAAPYKPSTVEYEPRKISDYDTARLPDGRATRQKRVICALLSSNNLIGKSACFASYWSMRKTGGQCNGSGVCVCRKRYSILYLLGSYFGI